jgi:hypothetical protein
MDESADAAKLRRRSLWLGGGAMVLGLLVIALVATFCLVLYLRYEHGLGG